MRAGSAVPALMAASTLAASACTRASMLVLAAASGARTCQPISCVQVCHWAASAGSMSAMAGGFGDGAGCAEAANVTSRLMTQTAANALGQLFDVIGLFDGGHGDDVTVVLLQVEFQLLGEIRELGGVFHVLLIFGSEDLVFLRLAVGENDSLILVSPAAAAGAAAALRQCDAAKTGDDGDQRAYANPVFHERTRCYDDSENALQGPLFSGVRRGARRIRRNGQAAVFRRFLARALPLEGRAGAARGSGSEGRHINNGRSGGLHGLVAARAAGAGRDPVRSDDDPARRGERSGE